MSSLNPEDRELFFAKLAWTLLVHAEVERYGDECGSIFTLHSSQGVPLTVSMMLLREKGLRVNLSRFYFDSIGEWSSETSVRCIREACSDNDLPFDEDEFLGLAKMWWYKCDGDITKARASLPILLPIESSFPMPKEMVPSDS